MALREYRKKRHFSRTSEPAGKKVAKKSGQRFVIQKHAATRLHYDFRLEMDVVLKSWAVPKGPCLDPAEKRLAAHVEDHPIEYRDFEGIIPQGEYGGGTVLVWDQGTWDADHDLAAEYRRGRMKFRLHGEKLQGGWNLVRMKARKPGADDWLLIKEGDKHARPLSEFDVLTARPESVLTERTIEEIAKDADRVWHSNRGAKHASVRVKPAVKRRRVSTVRVSPAKIPGAIKMTIPARVELQLARLKSHAPDGPEWLHEIKFDGYRLLAKIEKGKVALITRGKKDWTKRFSEVAAELASLGITSAWLDGEVVAFRPDGVSDFGTLQSSFRKGKTDQLVFCVFDLLYVNGYDLREAALSDRKKVLATLLEKAGTPRLRYVDHIDAHGSEFLEQCCRMGLEGCISKRRDRPYQSGRGDDWIKAKCRHREKFVVGGYIDPSSRKKGIGALLLGSFTPDGKLLYEGRVGTGFTDKVEADLLLQLDALGQDRCPFEKQPAPERSRAMHWVRPKLVAEVEFTERTNDGLLRHASFQGVYKEGSAASIVREPPEDASKEDEAVEEKPTATKPERKRKGGGNHDAFAAKNLEQLKDIRLTHPEKVMYPKKGITKLDLVSYYVTVADFMLPHIVHRPLSMVRCPDGAGGQCFYQKHASVGTPDVLTRIPISEDKKREEYLMVEDLPGLCSLVQMGILEIHPWGSRGDLLEKPDRMFFDLDPDDAVPWKRTIAAAKDIREMLKDLGLVSFVKTTGGKGLHVVVPLERRHSWDEVKAFSQAIAKRMVADAPRDFVATMSKAARKGKIYVDYQRNGRGATAVAPYSTRAREDATISMPLHWHEVSERITPDYFDVTSGMKRMASLRNDPWADMNATKQGITAKARKAVGL
jgi:bifunctional non-homologous end joining protein LigD